MMFNSRDWYWFVAGDESQVYSSKRNIYVDPTTDSDYTAWKATFEQPLAAADESEIWYYVKDWQPWWVWDGTHLSRPDALTYYKGQLQNYNSDTRTRKVAGGMTAAGIPVKTDDISRGFITSAAQQARQNPAYTAKWYGSDGNFYDVDAATMINISVEVETHTNTCYSVFQQTDNKIITNIITTLAEIDTAYSGL